jgi:hypothetical protein
VGKGAYGEVWLARNTIARSTWPVWSEQNLSLLTYNITCNQFSFTVS